MELYAYSILSMEKSWPARKISGSLSVKKSWNPGNRVEVSLYGL